LGDIPILGYLFKEKHSAVHKKNLLLFLTAKVSDQQNLSAYEKMMLEKASPDALQDVRYTEDEDVRPFLYKSAKEPPPPTPEPAPSPEPAVGSPAYIVPVHVCSTVNLWDEAVVVDARGEITGTWQIAARGH